MDIYEDTRLDDWLDIHNDSCDARHTQRSCRTLPELVYWLGNNLKVDFECDNIYCNYKWQIYKSVFFVDDTTVKSYLKCPSCHKLFVTAKWVYFTPEMMGEWKCGCKWMYDVNEFTREFEENTDGTSIYARAPGTIPGHMEQFFLKLILHFHQQYPLRTEGNHFY